MELRPLTSENMETVRVWRHGVPESLRTTQMLTAEMQQQYYRDVICNRDSGTRYWGLWEPFVTPLYRENTAYLNGETGEYTESVSFIGYGGIENISWENGNGEISLLLGPDYRGKGYGKQAVGLFLEQAFNTMGLKCVYGECYDCGPYWFWHKMCVEVYGYVEPSEMAWCSILPRRKLYRGVYYDSYYFTFSAAKYRNSAGAHRQPTDTTEEHP